MNKHANIPAASPLYGSNLAGVSVTPPLSEAPATFSCRVEPCGDCDRATDIKCDTCWSSGEVDAACADCARVVPINGDGLCLYCADMNELSTVQLHAKWLCAGVLRNPETRVEL